MELLAKHRYFVFLNPPYRAFKRDFVAIGNISPEFLQRIVSIQRLSEVSWLRYWLYRVWR